MIKDYEKYINGEYVRLSDMVLDYMDLYPIVKILGKRSSKINKSFLYRVEGIDSKKNILRIVSFDKDELEFSKDRIATQEEIDEYEFLKSANKYNL